jgi:cobyrinic acid a,c-diamide synthase
LKKALVVSAVASNQGKTLLTMALLIHFRDRVRAFKIGPDFIDPQFHQKVSGYPSINLDGFMMDNSQLRWIFDRYMDRDVAICEGVMGFYDGMDRGSSAYDIANILQIPTLLILDASGSYITIVAVLKGLLSFREDNTIVAVVFNRVSSTMHFELIQKQIKAEFDNIVVVGWIAKDLPAISSRHLGLDLEELDNLLLEEIALEVLEHIEIELLESIMDIEIEKSQDYPFRAIIKRDKNCALVYDKNFSFLYYDNLCYLKEIYKEVVIVDSTLDESIPKDSDIVIIVGGYVETKESYDRVKNSYSFRDSLISHAKRGKEIYAECAGLIYLGKSIDEKQMSGILDIEFTLKAKRVRLGYYYGFNHLTKKIQKGHAFHYSTITKAPKGDIGLYKSSPQTMQDGGWIEGSIKGSYLHTMWR